MPNECKNWISSHWWGLSSGKDNLERFIAVCTIAAHESFHIIGSIIKKGLGQCDVSCPLVSSRCVVSWCIVSSLCCIGGTCYSFNVSIPLGHSRTYHFTSIKAFTLGTTVVHIMMKENATWQGRPAHFDSINEILAPWLLLSIPLRPSELIEFLLPSCVAPHMC